MEKTSENLQKLCFFVLQISIYLFSLQIEVTGVTVIAVFDDSVEWQPHGITGTVPRYTSALISP